jgi:translation initiation factor 2B subunit (eIF-2B alpha/beta/delta family)
MEINDEFKSSWEQNNQRFGINEKFPECVLQISIQIKEFMEPENRIYQGAMGNAKGMVDAIKSYIACSEIDNTEKFVSNINLIIDYLLKIRLTSQVPLNTAFFIRQKLNKLNCNQFCIDDMKKLVADECDFHMTNYNLGD